MIKGIGNVKEKQQEHNDVLEKSIKTRECAANVHIEQMDMNQSIE